MEEFTTTVPEAGVAAGVDDSWVEVEGVGG